MHEVGRPPLSGAEREVAAVFVDTWFREELAELPVLMDVTRDEDDPYLWYVRLHGERRDVTAIWFTLGQRTLKYESYFLPYPEENREEFFGFLMRQNYELVGAQFGIGPEDAVFLSGEISLHSLDEHELDRIVGSIYQYTERFFRAALRLGFAGRVAAGQVPGTTGGESVS